MKRNPEGFIPCTDCTEQIDKYIRSLDVDKLILSLVFARGQVRKRTVRVDFTYATDTGFVDKFDRLNKFRDQLLEVLASYLGMKKTTIGYKLIRNIDEFPRSLQIDLKLWEKYRILPTWFLDPKYLLLYLILRGRVFVGKQRLRARVYGQTFPLAQIASVLTHNAHTLGKNATYYNIHKSSRDKYIEYQPYYLISFINKLICSGTGRSVQDRDQETLT